jgi:restriction system protein
MVAPRKYQSKNALKEPSPALIDVTTMPLEEWLQLLFNPPPGSQFIHCQFPTDRHRDEYLNSLGERSEDEVRLLLRRFLIPTGKLGIDRFHFASLIAAKKSSPEMFVRMMSNQYFRRVAAYFTGLSIYPPWEGNTWVLDLLPHFPKQALEGLNAYFLAHAQELPDGRLIGLGDAQTIIRARYIGIPGTNSEKLKFLHSLEWRGFECIVERLYDSMEYETHLTPPRKDGGRDILAKREQPGSSLQLRIECKHYFEEPVGLGVVQRLLGVVSGEKVNKGVVATTSRFTKPAKDYANDNPRLELLDGNQLVILMNEHLGPSWPRHIDRLIAEGEQTLQKNA